MTKTPKITGLNDYRPVFPTSVVMKSFERLVFAYLKASTGPLWLVFTERYCSVQYGTVLNYLRFHCQKL